MGSADIGQARVDRAEGLRIYNLFPTMAGPIKKWHDHLPRIAAMGFNAVYLNPFHEPGFSGSLYAVKDYYRLNPALRGDATNDDDTLLQGFTAAAREHGLRVLMDLVVNHTSKDSPLVTEHPEWFARGLDGEVESPYATDPADPTRRTVWGDLAEIDYSPANRGPIGAYFQELVRHYVGLGFGGFRCDAAYKVPAEMWRGLVRAARKTERDTVFCAENLGAPREAVLALAGAGFDYLFNSVKWWDYESPWLLEQYDAFRNIAPSIGFPESHDTERLVTDFLVSGVPASRIEQSYKQAYAFSAAFSTGVMIPMGYEWGWSRRLDVVKTTDADPEKPRFDISAYIAEINALKRAVPALNSEGPQHRLTAPGDPLVVLAREDRAETGEWAFTIVNTLDGEARQIPVDLLTHIASGEVEAGGATAGNPHPVEIAAAEIALEDLSPGGLGAEIGEEITVEPLGIAILRGSFPAASLAAGGETLKPAGLHPLWRRDGRIVIEGVIPEIDGGRYPIKRVPGDILEVRADMFRDGHDKIRAVLKYAPEGESWREAPFTFFDNDQWIARCRLDRVGRWRYTIEAWTDHFESWRGEFAKKLAAGQNISLELIEGRELIETALTVADPLESERLVRYLGQLEAGDDAARSALMLSRPLRALMARCQDRGDKVGYGRELEVVVDPVAAGFAAWYEMFQRSQGQVPGRGATFDDCIARLPEIASLGFDVVYLVPIHPIGRVNRKGKDNNTKAEPGAPGSPYAIGAAEGGHKAVNPELGTLEDFRRFVGAAGDLGMEVALDFAVQCAPDHPWVKEHKAWFRYRPDGTIKFAENPPKKYEDIVNVDFYNAEGDALWIELRDTFLFWVEQGVRTFRVDNPHTKPIPFWEWVIREVKTACPEAMFLAEAFTRPKVMRNLAKAGFTQSYSYFTWRNTKDELTEYLTELTTGPAKEYFRPNFFANTPDILPVYLQEGGRSAFRIRLVLAATLAGVYGIYNGYELCENTPIPGREEYLHSEKYEYKVWDWNRPGNIKAEIARINQFRRDNLALHDFLNLQFLHSADPNILVYAKATADRSNIVIVAVNVDPFGLHEGDFEVPLEALGLPRDRDFALEEALTGEVVRWRGTRQRVRLDPHVNPAVIYSVIDRSPS